MVVLDCFCPCERTKNLLIIKNEAQLKAKIDMMREDLAVNKPLLSSSIRRKISVSDSRPSSIVIGSTLGISLLTLMLVLIFVSDFHHLVSDIRHGLKNTRRAFLFLQNHVCNVKNRTVFASQDFSGQSRSPENINEERTWPKHLAFDKRSGPKIPRHDYTSINGFVWNIALFSTYELYSSVCEIYNLMFLTFMQFYQLFLLFSPYT